MVFQIIGITTYRPAPVLSFLNLDAKSDNGGPSSFEQAELVSCLDDELTDIPDPDPVGVEAALDTRPIGSGTFRGFCELVCGNDVVRECIGGGRTNQ